MANPYSHPMAGTILSTAKTEFEVRMLATMGAEAAAALSQGRTQLVDQVYYSVKALASNTQMELMEDKDNSVVGITNLNNRKLTTGEFFLLSGVQLLEADFSSTSGVTSASDIDTSKLVAASFGKITKAVANGEFELKVGETTVIPRISNVVFEKNEDESHLLGFYPLACKKMIAHSTAIKPSVWFNAAINSGKSALKVCLHGVKTVKA